MPKSFSAYSVIYSIVLSNNAWLPLSLNQPPSRNVEILEQAKPSLMIKEGELPEELAKYCSDNKVELKDIHDLLKTSQEVEIIPDDIQPEDVAYIMFTSGSTGIPKGVPMTHANYIPFVENIMDILPFRQGQEVFSDFHEFSFDISIFYLFACPLCEGAFCPTLEEKDRTLPINLVQKNKITVWSSVPSVINRIKMFRPKGEIDNDIHIMFLCGEPFKLDVLKYCYDNLTLTNVYNFYGLTETAVENFYYHASPEDVERFQPYGVLPIGKPLPGNEVKVIDRELLLAGIQVTPGYLGGRSPEKFEMIDGIRFYHTGDIVEVHDGLYFCKGRMDSQVKISGHRIELLDIEAHLMAHPMIDQAVCLVYDRGGQSSIGVAVMPKDGFDFSTVQNDLLQKLPPYMIPKKAITMERFPLNNSGKVDRKQLTEQITG